MERYLVIDSIKEELSDVIYDSSVPEKNKKGHYSSVRNYSKFDKLENETNLEVLGLNLVLTLKFKENLTESDFSEIMDNVDECLEMHQNNGEYLFGYVIEYDDKDRSYFKVRIGMDHADIDNYEEAIS